MPAIGLSYSLPSASDRSLRDPFPVDALDLFPNLSVCRCVTISDEGATYTVEEAIERLGYGVFQLKLVAIIGLAWVSV